MFLLVCNAEAGAGHSRHHPHLGLALVLLQADLAGGAALGQLQVLVHIIPGQ